MAISPGFLDELSAILSGYEIGKLTGVREVSGGYANRNFILETSTGKFIFRIFVQQGIPGIRFEMEVMERLQAVSFPTAYPVKNRDGEYISLSHGGPAVIYRHIHGKKPSLSARSATGVARALGMLHTAVNCEGLAKKNAVHPDESLVLIEDFPGARCQYPDIFGFFIEETALLDPFLREKLPRGLVHGDAWPDNILFHRGSLVALLDFEESCIDHLLFDIGIGVNAFCFRENHPDRSLVRAFLDEYQKLRKLDQEEKELLPHYIRWGAQGMILWHMKHLVHRHYSRQLARVRELISRIIFLRKNPVYC